MLNLIYILTDTRRPFIVLRKSSSSSVYISYMVVSGTGNGLFGSNVC